MKLFCNCKCNEVKQDQQTIEIVGGWCKELNVAFNTLAAQGRFLQQQIDALKSNNPEPLSGESE